MRRLPSGRFSDQAPGRVLTLKTECFDFLRTPPSRAIPRNLPMLLRYCRAWLAPVHGELRPPSASPATCVTCKLRVRQTDNHAGDARAPEIPGDFVCELPDPTARSCARCSGRGTLVTPLPGPTAKIRDMTFDRPMFQGQPDLIERPRILTKAVIGGPGHLQLLREIGWEFDLEPAWQCGLPSDQLPLSATFAVFTANAGLTPGGPVKSLTEHRKIEGRVRR